MPSLIVHLLKPFGPWLNLIAYFMPNLFILQVVRPSGLILADHLLDTIETQSTTRSSDLHYRGFLLPDINVATAARNAKVRTEN